MSITEHARITGGALKNWAIAQLQDSLAVGVLWWIGLSVLKVPWAPFWAVLAAALQIVPHIGPVLSVLGPVLAAWIQWGNLQHSLYVLILYAGIVIVDGFLLQPYIMKRAARVPIWAFDPHAHCIGSAHSILGSADLRPLAGGGVCLQRTSGESGREGRPVNGIVGSPDSARTRFGRGFWD